MQPNRKLFFWALTSALAGFLFGFDTIVISGVEQRIQEIWNLSSFMHGLNMSAALWGTVIGSFGYIASLGICAWAFSVESYKIVPICIFAFIAAHAIGQGTVIWVLISEIFPNRNRAAGQALGSFTHWFFAASLTFVFPKMAEALAPAIIFGFFTFMMCLQLLWVKTMVPETKGITLEEMQHKLGRTR